jgi:hypothetical protein
MRCIISNIQVALDENEKKVISASAVWPFTRSKSAQLPGRTPELFIITAVPLLYSLCLQRILDLNNLAVFPDP